MRSLQLCSVRLLGGQDWKQLAAMKWLTSLTLSSITSELRDPDGKLRSRVSHDKVSAILAGLPCLEQLCVTDAFSDFLSGLTAPLTCLVFNLSNCYSAFLNVAHLARLTTLQTLVCTGCRAPEARQIRALTHIPNLIVR